MHVRQRRKIQGYEVCRHWRTSLVTVRSLMECWERRSTWGFSRALGALTPLGGCQELLLGINTHKTFD